LHLWRIIPKTLDKERKIMDLGYNLITIWENDWNILNRGVKILQRKFRSLIVSILFFVSVFPFKICGSPILFQFIRVGVFIFYIVLRTFFYDFAVILVVSLVSGWIGV
jgi:hypothetical protein